MAGLAPPRMAYFQLTTSLIIDTLTHAWVPACLLSLTSLPLPSPLSLCSGTILCWRDPLFLLAISTLMNDDLGLHPSDPLNLLLCNYSRHNMHQTDDNSSPSVGTPPD
ncbi:hypothetical protein B0H16DRAFT_1741867 [Mycena metata]|uniref:Uncharacterized protein n=1 Tax=Mycena metata TaxID=1033252 RepID=A0AAD7MGQ3_9AGAR|nr:hypothetical protein B0H16DRAFT_1741867 [Mycena metata]